MDPSLSLPDELSLLKKKEKDGMAFEDQGCFFLHKAFRAFLWESQPWTELRMGPVRCYRVLGFRATNLKIGVFFKPNMEEKKREKGRQGLLLPLLLNASPFTNNYSWVGRTQGRLNCFRVNTKMGPKILRWMEYTEQREREHICAWTTFLN